MSKVNVEAEHLIRAAMDSIRKHPEQWDQTTWASKTDCGTAFCLGGWMAIHDGWKFHHEVGDQIRSWTKGEGDRTVRYHRFAYILEPYVRDIYPEFPSVYNTMFGGEIETFEALTERVVKDTSIDFDAPCPCVADDTLCLKPCGCGHPTPVPIDTPFNILVRKFVKNCVDDGIIATEAEVFADRVLMKAFTNFLDLGELNGIKLAKSRYNAGILEAHTELVKMTQSRDRVIENNSKLNGEIEALNRHIIGLSRQRLDDSWDDDTDG